MKEIDHDPNENRKLPNYGERDWARQKYGRDANPGDLLYFLIPIAVIAVAMFLWRGY